MLKTQSRKAKKRERRIPVEVKIQETTQNSFDESSMSSTREEDTMTIKRFDGENFHVWKHQIQVNLKSKVLMSYVLKKKPRPSDEEGSDKQDLWDKMQEQ
jgi:ACT domain-containing protein